MSSITILAFVQFNIWKEICIALLKAFRVDDNLDKVFVSIVARLEAKSIYTSYDKNTSNLCYNWLNIYEHYVGHNVYGFKRKAH